MRESERISRLEEMGKMSPEEAECIYIKDILSFVRSDLGQRMKKPQEQKLFREQPFVISVQASEMNDSGQEEKNSCSGYY